MTKVEVELAQLQEVAASFVRDGYIEPVMHTAVDRLDHLELVYLLRRPRPEGGRILDEDELLLRTRVPANKPEAPSLVAILPGLEFQEREVYDLFGVRYHGHPDLRRILLPESYHGHPLRKSYTNIDGTVGQAPEEVEPGELEI
ncbi:MAG: NADH-quinone oxidoreductase subunit C [Firmicutes bacterium]|nr:NADH-quinone oxidoreductase subunit C [Bacillota bacterium]